MERKISIKRRRNLKTFSNLNKTLAANFFLSSRRLFYGRLGFWHIFGADETSSCRLFGG
jgi:hypothetical protein